MNDTSVRLVVDGQQTLFTSFREGFDWWAQMQPGMHTVHAEIAAPLGFTRSKTYALEVRAGLTTVAVLEYSRMWGNFTSRPARVDFVTR